MVRAGERVQDEMRVPPCWRITSAPTGGDADAGRLVIERSGAFGDGTHPTTQLCLQAIAAFAPRPPRSGWRMLDFGSGSGILAIAAAKLGGIVDGIEIDDAAITQAQENARLNGVAERVRYGRALDEAPGPYELVVANILRPVLLAFASDLCARRDACGRLILSGLVATDVPEVTVRYAPLLGGERPQIYQRGEWRALAWPPREVSVANPRP